MKLDDLCMTFSASNFPQASEIAHPERRIVERARVALREALQTRAFLIDCIDHELRLVARGGIRRGLVPFHTMPDLGIRFAFGYWPPGSTPGPHEHTAWTITAVCRNRLAVATFDRLESYRLRTLVAKNLFDAETGQVGYIFEPAIHAPKNPSSAWTLSLHVTSPRDGEPVADCQPLPELQQPSALDAKQLRHPYIRVVMQRDRERFLKLLVNCLLDDRSPESVSSLTTCFNLGSYAIRKQIASNIELTAMRNGDAELLERAHADLALHVDERDDRCALVCETPHGPSTELVVSRLAREALRHVAEHPQFAVSALPGDLSSEERTALGEVLESTGVFVRVHV